MLQFHTQLLAAHVTLAIVSPVLFSLRALRAVRGLDPARGWLRYAPHAVDSALLLAGLALATNIRQYPFADAWLTAKFLALLGYITAGHFAVRRARTGGGRIAAFGAALAILAYIYAVALTRDPLPSIPLH